jgi:methionyl-tRNA formyltransferase
VAATGSDIVGDVRIVLCCATARGVAFLDRLAQLAPEAELTVVSFPEQAHEPRFLAELQARAAAAGAVLVEKRRLVLADLEAARGSSAFDLLFAVSWRYLVPPEVFRQARLGAFVLHDSLLPGYRGFAPTVWAIANGEKRTGATLCRMEEAVDSGEIIDQAVVPIGPEETIAEVLPRVTATYLEILARTLPQLLAGSAAGQAQDESQATYCCARRPEDNEIDWLAGTDRIHDLIRAVTHPYPGAYTELDGRRLRVWSARRIAGAPRYVGGVPGRIVAKRPGEGSVVLTANGALLLERVQLDGEAECAADEILSPPFTTLGRGGRP